MKIAVVAPTKIPALRANTLQVMKMTQAIVSLGHQVHLLTPVEIQKTSLKPSTTPVQEHLGPSWDDLAQHYGLKHSFPITQIPAKPHLRRYDFGVRAVWWCKKRNIELIYTRLPQAAASASQLGIPTIFEIHDLPKGSVGPWLFQRFLKGKGARRLVVITQALAKDLNKGFGAPSEPPFTVIAPDGVDLERYEGLQSPQEARISLNKARNPWLSQELKTDQFIAGYTGHLYQGRGLELLLNLAIHMPDMTFLIVGGEPEHVKHLKKSVAAIGADNFILTGFVPNAELPRFQAACDVLLMPYQQRVTASSGGDISRYLSPMKLFEYMACERVILSSDLPVLREALNPQNSILLPSDDVEAWAAALQNLRRNPEKWRKLAERARQDANRYTWKSRASRILEGI